MVVYRTAHDNSIPLRVAAGIRKGEQAVIFSVVDRPQSAEGPEQTSNQYDQGDFIGFR